MNLTGKDQINQRIERITDKHLVVGIDIAKDTHVAAAVNFRGVQVGKAFAFSNDLEGYEKLMGWVGRLQRTSELTGGLLFAMEPTGHYGLALANWLYGRGEEAVHVNPMLTKRHKEDRDNRPSKNDAKDAVVIADLTCRGYYSPIRWEDPIYQKLRSAFNEREMIAVDMAALGNQLQQAIGQAFPEFFRVFTKWDGPRALATLRQFPLPKQLQGMGIDAIIEGWRDGGMGRAGGKSGKAWAVKLRLAAQGSIGLQGGVEEELGKRIARLMRRYDAAATHLAEVDAEIALLMAQMPAEVLWPLQQLSLSPLFQAAILANAGALEKFLHGNHVVSLAGLDLCECTSGKRKGSITLSKRGRRQLRKYLYLAVLGLVANHPSFKAWHTHNVEVKKMKRQRSLFKLIGKLCRILVALAHSKKAFRPEQDALPSAA